MSSSVLESPETELAKLRRLHRAQQRLVTAVHELSLTRSLPAIQEIVRHAAREIAGADGASFVLRDRDKCYYADEDAISPLWKGCRFPLSACISGWAMLNAQSVVIPDIYADPRIPADAYRPTFVKSLVMVPIRVHSPIGAIGTYWAEHRTATVEEVGLLQALANTTAVAMENVQVYRELELRVANRTEQLEAVNRELEAFSYSVSHDLRAPLRGVHGFLDMAVKELGPIGDKPRRFLDRAQANANQMSHLIEDLLKLAMTARQEVRRVPLDLAAIARDIAQRRQADEPQRQVEIVIADTLPTQGDAGLLTAVLENLLSNAWKYSSKTENARIEVGAETSADGERVFFVRDNGAGFDMKYAEKLFTPLQRFHTIDEFPGTGIGLATVQRIIHRHGGRIWAQAEAGRGATFYFTCAEKGAAAAVQLARSLTHAS